MEAVSVACNDRQGPAINGIGHIVLLVHREEGVVNILGVIPECCLVCNGCSFEIRVPLCNFDLNQSEDVIQFVEGNSSDLNTAITDHTIVSFQSTLALRLVQMRLSENSPTVCAETS